MNPKVALIAASAACVLSVGSLAGCAGAPQNNAASQAQIDNRTYMSQVNQTMSSLNEKLDGFVDAVSRGDVVGMKTQSERALAELDAINSLEAPEALSEVNESYKAGCEKMKLALQSYVDLLSSGADKIDAESIKPIQEAYDEGVAALQEADQKASEMA